MADVTGPIRSLPGSRHKAPAGATCDDHPDRPAAGRVQGETDSFGSEMLDLCQECLDALATELAAQAEEERFCQWCSTMAKDVRPHRDFEEGSAGPVYQVCGACRCKESEALAAEAEDHDPLRGLGW